MSTILLATATRSGALTLGPLGALAAGLATAYIDNVLLNGLLGRGDSPAGPRLDEVQLGQNSQGAAVNRLFGKRVRCSGTLVWFSPVRVVEDDSVGSKGGPGGDFVRFKTYRDVAVSFARLKRGKKIKRVVNVYANGQSFYRDAQQFNASSNKITCEALLTVSSTIGGSITAVELRIVSDEAAGGPDLSLFQSGRDVVVSGWNSTSGLSTDSPFLTANASSGASTIFVSAGGVGLLSVNDTLTIGGVAGTYTVASPASTYYYGSTLTGTINVATGGATSGAIAVPLATGAGEAINLKANDKIYFSNQSSIEYTILEDLNVGASSSGTVFIDPPLEGNVTTAQTVSIGRPISVTPNLAGAASSGANVNVTSGATANNGTYRCWASGRLSLDRSYIIIRKRTDQEYPFAGKSGAFSPETVTLTQEDVSFSRAQADDIRFYDGSRTQLPDALILDAEGATLGEDQVTAHRGQAMMWVESMQMTDFGNVLPNFEFDVEVEEDDRLSTAVLEMCLDSGESEDTFEVSAIPDSLKLGGYVWRGPQVVSSALQPVLIANHLLSQHTLDGRIGFVRRDLTELFSITGRTAFAEALEQRPDRPGTFGQAGDLQIVQVASVKYVDIDKNLTAGKKSAPGTTGLSQQFSEFDSQIVMTGDEAQKLVNILFELGRTGGRHQAVFFLPPSLMFSTRESMRLGLSALGQNREFIVTRVEEGHNGLVRVETLEEDLEAFDQDAVVSEGSQALTIGTSGKNRPIDELPDVDPVFMDLPALQDSHVNVPGFYVAATQYESSKSWASYTLYQSDISSTNFRARETFSQRATIGKLLSAPLDSSVVDYREIDYASSILVELVHPHDELSSVSLDEMLRGLNRFLIGDEIIGAATAELVSSDYEGRKTYRLSTLVRGMLDTFPSMAHETNERVVWLDGPGIYFVPFSVGKTGQTSYYKTISVGGIVADSATYEFTPTASTCRPFRPVYIQGIRNGGNDLTITWERQFRKSVQSFYGVSPVDAESETYIVRVLAGPNSGTAVRKVQQSSRSWTYTSSQQLVDGFTPPESITVEIVQINQLSNEGNVSKVTL